MIVPMTGSSETVEVRLNGEAVSLAAGTTLSELVARWCGSDRGVAVAVNQEVIPRSVWSDYVVTNGAAVEIVTAAAGG